MDKAELGGEDDLPAALLDLPADQELVGVRAVGIRRVEKIDPEIERPVERRHRFRIVPGTVRGRHPHASEAEG